MPINKQNLFSIDGARPTAPVVPLVAGRFTPREAEDIRKRFFRLGWTIHQLARAHVCGHVLIQDVLRMRRPPTIALVNDRRGKRTA